jgi:glyoxylase-like metal-dependent hydrolase (beta-lactamase superfamily II)
MKTCEQLGLTIEAILLTHGHFDHVGGVQPLVQATGCALWMSQGDWSQVRNPMNDYLYPIANCDFTDVQFCEDGQVIRAADLAFSVLETPGHSWGSVCYRCGDAIFSGDTLFAGGCGRTDLPGGDWNTIRESLHRLADLPGNADVYPGHGESTTLDNERRNNPYFY